MAQDISKIKDTIKYLDPSESEIKIGSDIDTSKDNLSVPTTNDPNTVGEWGNYLNDYSFTQIEKSFEEVKEYLDTTHPILQALIDRTNKNNWAINNNNMKGFGIKFGQTNLTTTDAKYLYVHGYDTLGLPVDADGWVYEGTDSLKTTGDVDDLEVVELRKVLKSAVLGPIDSTYENRLTLVVAEEINGIYYPYLVSLYSEDYRNSNTNLTYKVWDRVTGGLTVDNTIATNITYPDHAVDNNLWYYSSNFDYTSIGGPSATSKTEYPMVSITNTTRNATIKTWDSINEQEVESVVAYPHRSAKVKDNVVILGLLDTTQTSGNDVEIYFSQVAPTLNDLADALTQSSINMTIQEEKVKTFKEKYSLFKKIQEEESNRELEDNLTRVNIEQKIRENILKRKDVSGVTNLVLEDYNNNVTADSGWDVVTGGAAYPSGLTGRRRLISAELSQSTDNVTRVIVHGTNSSEVLSLGQQGNNVVSATSLDSGLTVTGDVLFNRSLITTGSARFDNTVNIRGILTTEAEVIAEQNATFQSRATVLGEFVASSLVTLGSTTAGITNRGHVINDQTVTTTGESFFDSGVTIRGVGNSLTNQGTTSLQSTTIHGDLYAHQDIDAGTLNVRDKATVNNFENTGTFLMSSLTGTSVFNNSLTARGNLRVESGSTLVGATSLLNTLSVTGSTNLSSTLSVTGNTNITGSLTTRNFLRVYGTSTLDSDTFIKQDLDVTGDIIGSNITARNHLLTTTLRSTDKSELQELSVDTLINTATLQVNSTSRLTGAITALSTMDLTSHLTVGTGNFRVNTGTGYIKGATTIDGATAINNTLTVSGITTLEDQLRVTGRSTQTGITNTGTLINTGNVTVTGTVGISGKTTTGSLESTSSTKTATLETTGTSVLNGNVTANSNINLTGGNLTVNGTATVTGHTELGTTTNIGGNTHITGTLETTSNTKVNGTLEVVGNTNLSTLDVNEVDITGDIEVQNAVIRNDVTIARDLDLNRNADIAGTLNVTGGTTTSTIANSGLTTSGSLRVTGDANLTGGTTTVTTSTVLGNQTVAGSSTVRNLTTTQDARINTDLNVDGKTTTGSLQSTGVTTLDGAVTINSQTTSRGINTTGNVNVTGEISSTGNIHTDGNISAEVIYQKEIVGTGRGTLEDIYMAKWAGSTGFNGVVAPRTAKLLLSGSLNNQVENVVINPNGFSNISLERLTGVVTGTGLKFNSIRNSRLISFKTSDSIITYPVATLADDFVFSINFEETTSTVDGRLCSFDAGSSLILSFDTGYNLQVQIGGVTISDEQTEWEPGGAKGSGEVFRDKDKFKSLTGYRMPGDNYLYIVNGSEIVAKYNISAFTGATGFTLGGSRSVIADFTSVAISTFSGSEYDDPGVSDINRTYTSEMEVTRGAFVNNYIPGYLDFAWISPDYQVMPIAEADTGVYGVVKVTDSVTSKEVDEVPTMHVVSELLTASDTDAALNAWKQTFSTIGNTSVPIDLNDIRQTGWYRSLTVNNLWNNKPSSASNAFTLFVESNSHDNSDVGFIKQTYSGRESNMTWTRVDKSGAGQDWTDWVVVTNERGNEAKTYSSLSELGLGNSVSTKEIYDAMEGNSRAELSFFSQSALILTDSPVGTHIIQKLQITKFEETGFKTSVAYLTSTAGVADGDEEFWICHIFSNTKFNWRRVTTDKNLGFNEDLTTVEKDTIVGSINELDQTKKSAPDPRCVYSLQATGGTLKEWSRSGNRALQLEQQWSAGKGGKDIRSRTGNGLSGALGADNMYIGPAYTNLFSTSLINFGYTSSGSNVSGVDMGDYYQITVDGLDSSLVNTTWIAIEIGTNDSTYVTLRSDNINNLSMYGFTKDTLRVDGDRLHHVGVYTANNSRSYITVENVSVGDTFKLYKDIMFAKSESEVPFVPDSAPQGRLVINEPWVRGDYSYVGVGYEIFNDETPVYGPVFYMDTEGFHFSNQFSDTSLLVDWYASNSVRVATNGVQSGGMSSNPNYVSTGVDLVFQNNDFHQQKASFKYFVVYEGNLTQGELEEELRKLKLNLVDFPEMPFEQYVPYCISSAGGGGADFTNVSDIVSSSTTTMQTIINNMSDQTIAEIPTENLSIITDLPEDGSGFLYIKKISDDNIIVTWNSNITKTIYTGWHTHSTWAGWNRDVIVDDEQNISTNNKINGEGFSLEFDPATKSLSFIIN